MKQRILTGIVLVIIWIPVAIFSDTWLFCLFFSILSSVGTFEMLQCTGVSRNAAVAVPTVGISAALPFLTRFIEEPADFGTLLMVVFFLLLFYLLAAAVFSRGKLKLNEIAVVFMMTLYIPGTLSCIILLRDLPRGAYLYYLVFIGAWITDIFAYFTGRFIGRHKLIPDVSPKKTVEGAVGGTVFCMASFALYGFVMCLVFDVTPHYGALLILGGVVSVISQIGDLAMSLIKRHYNIKDYGKIFPGHGGVLDRFDSVMAAAPFLYLLCASFKFFHVLF